MLGRGLGSGNYRRERSGASSVHFFFFNTLIQGPFFRPRPVSWCRNFGVKYPVSNSRLCLRPKFDAALKNKNKKKQKKNSPSRPLTTSLRYQIILGSSTYDVCTCITRNILPKQPPETILFPEFLEHSPRGVPKMK